MRARHFFITKIFSQIQRSSELMYSNILFSKKKGIICICKSHNINDTVTMRHFQILLKICILIYFYYDYSNDIGK